MTRPRGASLLRGNALRIPLADESVDLEITSPPYYALRSYRDGDEHYDGQLGSEPTPEDFLRGQWAVADEMWRVLKPTGSAWWNYGDKYAGSGGHNNSSIGAPSERGPKAYNKATGGIRAKSLMGLPWRFALGLIHPEWYRNPIDPPAPGTEHPQWILRAETVWDKPNGLPESVTDRVRRSHEQWFMFTKQGRYFAAVDEIRESRSHVVEPAAEHLPSCPLFQTPTDSLSTGLVGGGHETVPSIEAGNLPDQKRSDVRVERHHISGAEQPHEVGSGRSAVPLLAGGDPEFRADPIDLFDDGEIAAVDGYAQVGGLGAAMRQGDGSFPVDDSCQPSQVCTCGHTTYRSGLGKLPGSVWSIPSAPLKVPEHLGVDHFAAFPPEWPRRIIQGWSPSGICTACGQGRRPVVAKSYRTIHIQKTDARTTAVRTGGATLDADKRPHGVAATEATVTGYACACPDTSAPTRPAVVLDPFAGTGTVPMVARALGRYGIGIDLSRDYLRLANWRVFESEGARKVAAKRDRENQQELFGGAA